MAARRGSRILSNCSPNISNPTPTTPTPCRGPQYTNVSPIESDETSEDCHDTSADDDELVNEELTTEAPTLQQASPGPTGRIDEGLNLFNEDNEYLTVHRWHDHSMYYYDESEDVSERHRRAFEDVACESASHIKWGSDRRKQNDLWGNFAGGVDVKAPHKAKVACRWCGKILFHPQASPNSKGNLNSLKNHLRECKKTVVSSRTMAQFCAQGKRRATHYAYSLQNLQESQLALAVGCSIPFTTFEDPDFLHFLDMIRRSPSNNDISNRKKMARLLAAKTAIARRELAKELRQLESRVSLSLDAWTSPNHHPFLGIVIHFIDNTYTVRREVLGFEILSGIHSGMNMAEKIWSVLDEYDLLDKVGDNIDVSAPINY